MPVDVVGISRPSEEVPGIVEEALSRNDVEAIWMQPGVRNDEAVRAAEAAGLDVVRDRCTKVEHGQPVHRPVD